MVGTGFDELIMFTPLFISLLLYENVIPSITVAPGIATFQHNMGMSGSVGSGCTAGEAREMIESESPVPVNIAKSLSENCNVWLKSSAYELAHPIKAKNIVTINFS